MNHQNKSKEELISELQELRQENNILKASYNKDITERKSAKEASQETFDYLDSLFKYANVPIIVWNIQYKITRFNKAFETLTGRAEKDVIGKSIEILFPPTHKDSSMKLIEETLEGERWEVVEINILHIDGSIHTLLWNSANILSPDGKTPIATIAQGHDITKRIQAEIKLKEKNEKIEKQNEEIEKRASELVIANKELAFQAEEKGKRASELTIANKELDYQTAEKGKRADELNIANKELDYQTEEKGKRADELLIANKELVFQNEEKEKRAVELIIAKEKAEEFEKKFRQIAENIDEVFWLRTHSEMIYVSPSFEKIWGVPCQAIYDNPQIFTEKIHPEDKPVVQKIFQSNEFIDKGLFNYEYRILRADNQVRWINAKTVPIIDDSGKIVKRVGIASDITEKHDNVQELIKSKEHAEESDHLKTAFLHNISHEIRTPMNAIVGFSGFLNDPDLLPEKRQHFIDIIVQSSDQLLSIISDIVSIASIEAGQERIIEKEIDINAALILLHEQFLIKANKQNVSFILKSLLPEHEAWIKTDETKLVQVLSNLISNSLKFTKHGYVTFGAKVNDNQLEFFVEDTGLGIPLEMQEEIFKRFRQIEDSDTRQFGGSGLGLSISKAYVEILGGKMWLKSELGKGSTFYFTIPYTKAQKNILSEMQLGSKFKSEIKELRTLLIAEDEDSNFMLLEELLSGLNIHIIRAVNGFDAVEICRTNTHIDLVLMDIKMPVMDGYEATKQIKGFMPNLPIIAQTAYSTDIDKSKALACGCIDFLSKPIKRELLFSKIEEQLAKTI
jgi:PAS domain S-box-containing protein